MQDYTYYLFDADGTLFDTTELIHQCFIYSLKKHFNTDLPRKTILASIGMPLRTQFEIHLGPLSDDHYDLIQKDHMTYQLSIYKDYIKAFPGVTDTLARLQKNKKKLAVVTSRKITTLTLYLEETGLKDFFDILITPDETVQHKPAAEPALKAMELLGAEKAQSLFIGDSIFDIQCGTHAGIDTAFVTWSHNDAAALPVTPTYLINNMLELCV
ncbi:MAG: HAD-IA family hydrolase [Deltaproteobacteria bacterium]|nr:HAD-IA family hydrolase [Deltaproteobacteria bacterium]